MHAHDKNVDDIDGDFDDDDDEQSSNEAVAAVAEAYLSDSHLRRRHCSDSGNNLLMTASHGASTRHVTCICDQALICNVMLSRLQTVYAKRSHP